ncbi:MAG TPA: hypothetical protein VGE37_07405, partial [Archangium sp.]
MLSLILAIALSAAPDPQNVGSVDGLNLWVEGRGLVQTFDSVLAPNQSFYGLSQRSFLVFLSQGYAFAGWGFKLAEHRLLLGVSLGVTGVALDDPEGLRLPRVHFVPVAGTLSAVLRLGDVTLVPALSANGNQPHPELHDLGVTVRASFNIRHAAGPFVGGVGFSGELPLLSPARGPEGYFVMRRC